MAPRRSLLPQLPPAWSNPWTRYTVTTLLVAVVTLTVPRWWCGRDGHRWYDGDTPLVLAHARELVATVERGVSADDFTSASNLFKNEWRFGTYQMSALALLQICLDHPELRAGQATTAFLDENPPLSRPRLVSRPWHGSWRLNGPAPARTAPPVVDAAGQGDFLGVDRSLRAPMPGVVIRVLVAEGDRVQARQPLVVLEAMKMEMPFASPSEAVVRKVHVAEGERVDGGALLVELEE